MNNSVAELPLLDSMVTSLGTVAGGLVVIGLATASPNDTPDVGMLNRPPAADIAHAAAACESQTDAVAWPRACRAEFARLRREDPAALLRWVRAGVLSPAHASFALEALGASGMRAALPTLVRSALGARDPLVREGAVYGLAPYLDLPLRDVLALQTRDEPSAGVRRAIKGVIDA